MTGSEQQPEEPIKLVSECFVKPKFEKEGSKQPYHLGPVDIVMITIDPIQKGLLFTLKNSLLFSPSQNIEIIRNKVVTDALEKLKHSLSIALVHFYPLAGRFSVQKYPNENACSVFVDSNKGPGARFIHATAHNLTVSDILSPIDVTVVHPFFDLGEKYINYDCHSKALLSIQVTELLDGVFIGFSMSHSVVDGTSFIHFVNVLSEIFMSISNDYGNDTKVSRVPILDYRPWDVTNLKIPFDLEAFINRGYDPGPLRERIFHFSPSSMARLKAKANEQSGVANNVVISSFQALTALVWRSITRARNLPLDQDTTCFFTIGARSRLNPPISDDYFGNFIDRVQWACNVEELLGNGLGWAAMNLRKVIMEVDGKATLDSYKELAISPIAIPRGTESSSSNVHGVNSVIMGGSARFDMYGPEFGLGRALAARMGYGNKEDGKITANPGVEGGGSVDLEICLRPLSMAALEADQDFMSFAEFH